MGRPVVTVAGGAPHRHVAYGLAIDSTHRLPALAPRREGAGPADVVVRWGALPPVPPDAVDLGAGNRADDDTVWLSCGGMGQLSVSRGREIVVEAAPGVDEAALRLFVEGPGLGVALQQRGRLALHASGVAIGGAVAAFVGASGAGKSTMAAALRRRGHAVVADDVVPVDLSEPARPLVDPGYPELKLSAAAAAAVGEDPGVLVPLHAEATKFGCRVAEGVAPGRLPLARVYVLAVGGEPRVDVLQPQEALVELIRHTYTAALLQRRTTMPAHLRQCAGLVAGARVRRLTRPLALSRLADVSELVERDCAGAADSPPSPSTAR